MSLGTIQLSEKYLHWAANWLRTSANWAQSASYEPPAPGHHHHRRPTTDRLTGLSKTSPAPASRASSLTNRRRLSTGHRGPFMISIDLIRGRDYDALKKGEGTPRGSGSWVLPFGASRTLSRPLKENLNF
jgi:hypothetical protein